MSIHITLVSGVPGQGIDYMVNSVDRDRAGNRINLNDDQEARTLALRIADILSDTPAVNTILLEITEISSIADFFLLCSGGNERQLRAISDEVTEELAKDGIRPLRMEGTPRSGWILLDFGDVVAHVFVAELREFYKLEQLWAEAPRVLSIQ